MCVCTFIFIEICAETRVKKLKEKKRKEILSAFSSPSLRDVYFLICEHSKVRKERMGMSSEYIYYFYIYTSTSAAVAASKQASTLAF